MLIVANWKMELTYTQSLAWMQKHGKELKTLCHDTNTHFVLCPSFIPLASLRSDFYALGAQDCSLHEQGAYTGDISVASLKETGCSYCIVGHSERRRYYQETSEEVAQKVALLLSYEIQPIVCIGETLEQRELGITQEILQAQLLPVIEQIQNSDFQQLCIAYEPVWAIGTGIIPAINELDLLIKWLRKFITASLPDTTSTLLYGGSVQPKNILELKSIKEIEGYLLGRASTHFQTLKQVISHL